MSRLTRRDFLKAGAAAAAGFTLIPDYSASAKDQPNKKVSVKKETLEMRLGNSNIKVTKITGKDTGIVYWRPHSNEEVAAQAIEYHIRNHGGTGYIIHTDEKTREIPFKVGEKEYKIDPNRMFTKRGRENYCSTKEGTAKYKAIETFANKWLGLLKKHDTIVTVHNNKNGYKGDGEDGWGTISIDRSESRYKERYPGAVHVSHREDEDDLFWVTEKRDFNHLSRVVHPSDKDVKGYNVILEPNVIKKNAYDDGSTSVVFCQEPHKKRYINCETEDGKDKRKESVVLKKQIEMLKAVHQYTAKQ